MDETMKSAGPCATLMSALSLLVAAATLTGQEKDTSSAASDDDVVFADSEATENGEDTGPTLSIGKAAPALAIGTWVKGDEVAEFRKGHIYVVEFWATWCGPCKASMPHLSQLQKEYGDKITVLGISDEEMPVVERFLAEEQAEGVTWDEALLYTIALDDDEATSDAYMKANEKRRFEQYADQ